MKVWETEMYAVSYITGELVRVTGFYISGKTYQDAVVNLRKLNLEHLQLTGKSYPDMESLNKEVLGEGEIKDIEHIDEEINQKIFDQIKTMTFDDFNDWLDISKNKNDILDAKRAFLLEGDMEEHIKMIDVYLERKYPSTEDNNDTKEKGYDEEG